MFLAKLRWRMVLSFLVVYANNYSSASERRRQAGGGVEFSGGAGTMLSCADAHERARTVWLTTDFAPLATDPRYWRVLPNGSLHILPSTDAAPPSALPAAVRCRVTTARGTSVTPPIALLPVWDKASPASTVEVSAVQAGGVAALRCVRPRTASLVTSLSESLGASRDRNQARWWRNDEPLLRASPTPSSQYVTAGEEGEWLLFDGAAPGDRFSCQTSGAARSTPFLLHVIESPLGDIPRLALSSAAVHAPAGAALCLPCAAAEHPPPHYTWYRESGGRLEAAHESGAWAWRGGAALCFTRTAGSASGAWICRASTTRGDATARVQLVVRPPLAVTLTPALTVASGGDTVRLECDTGEAEASVWWLHEGAPAAASDDVTPLGRDLAVRATSRTRGLWQCETRRGDEIEQATAEIRLAEVSPELRYTFIEQALRPGARVSLRCSAAGAPPPRFTWHRDGAPLQAAPVSHRYSIVEERSDSGETVSTLTIGAASPEDGGRYSCRAVNELGHDTHDARLNIYGPPLVRSMPPQRVLAGENVTLLCPYAGYPISLVTWHAGGGGSGAALGGEGRVAARGAALHLRPALAGDAGRYSCRVAAPSGAVATQDVQLLVLNPPKISPFMFSSELSEGNAVRVICSVSSGDRPLSFSWLKDGVPLSPDLQIEETSLDDFSLLKFGDLSARHSGDYTCRVTNPATSVDYTATLHVKVPPSWSREPLDTAVSVGAPLRLECAARGQPAPAVTWHHRQQCGSVAGVGPGTESAGAGTTCEWRALPGNGTLWAPAATPDLAGFYRCSADNGVGPSLIKYVNISVYEPAQIESSHVAANVTCVSAAGVDASCALRCVARGDDPLSVTWARSGRDIDLHSGRLSVSEARDATGALRSVLSVRGAGAGDAGQYRCRAENTRGISDRLYTLHIEEPPPAPADVRVAGREARRVRLTWRGARSLAHSAALEPVRERDHQSSDNLSLVLDTTGGHGCDGGRVCSWLEGLVPGGAYTVRVRAASRAGLSPSSAPVLFTTLEDAPSGVPQEIRTRPGEVGELHVSWSPPPPSTWNGELLGYLVAWRAVSGSVGGGAGRGVRRGGSSLVLGGLPARTQLAVTVRAFNRAGVGPVSPLVLAITPEGELEAPSEVRCAGVSASELRVSWSPHDARLQYDVLYAPAFPNTGVWSEAEEQSARGWRVQLAGPGVGETSGERMMGGLRAGTRYSVWVRVRHGLTSTPAYCATTPGAVSMISARAVGVDAVRVWWRPPEGRPLPTYYTLHARDLTRSGGGGDWSERVEACSAGAECWRVVAGLRRARHEFTVRAHSPAGPALPSPSARADTAHYTHNTAARIWSWSSSVVAAAGARVRLRCAADGAAPLRRRWAPAAHTLTPDGHLDIIGVQPQWAGNYTCSVRNALGGDSVTHTLRTRPAPEPPPAPAPPRLKRATPSELYLMWVPVKSTYPPLIGYTIEWQVDAISSEQWKATGAMAEQTARTLRGLACGARYLVTLRAHTALGASTSSPRLLASTAGHEPVPPAGGEFVWANSSALRLGLLQWATPCDVTGWSLALRPTGGDAWTELRDPHPLDDFVEVGELSAGAWYEVRVKARWAGGTVTAVYRAATLTADGELVGESMLVRGSAGAAGAGAGGGRGAGATLLPAALAVAFALIAVLFAFVVWRLISGDGVWSGMRTGTRKGARGGGTRPLRVQDELPPPPLPAINYTLTKKCDISDIRVLSARLSSGGSVCAGAGGGADSTSDSSAGEPCAACQRNAHTPARRHVPLSPPPKAVSNKFLFST